MVRNRLSAQEESKLESCLDALKKLDNELTTDLRDPYDDLFSGIFHFLERGYKGAHKEMRRAENGMSRVEKKRKRWDRQKSTEETWGKDTKKLFTLLTRAETLMRKDDSYSVIYHHHKNMVNK